MIQSDTCILFYFIIIYYLFIHFILFYFVETPKQSKKKLILFTIRECSKVERNKISIQSIVILYSNENQEI